MRLRHPVLAFALAFCLSVASPARALADDCPNGDSPDGVAQAACGDAVPAAAVPESVPADASDAAFPTIDANGDPIPYVEETTAPPLGTSLAYSDDGE